jgi:tetratricopeptide (TPR) repeat protein
VLKFVPSLFRSGALGLLVLAACLGSVDGRAETAAGEKIVTFKSPGAEDAAYGDLLKSNQQLREQLLQTQLQISTNRAESEAAARAQAAAIADKFEALKRTLEAERDRQKIDLERAALERDRQHGETQRWINAVLWTVFSFAALGLIAIVVGPWVQWRAVARLTEAVAHSPAALALAARPELAAPEAEQAANQTVERSNRRLLSVIDRIEQRVMELEHTANEEASSLPADEDVAAPSKAPAPSSRPVSAARPQARAPAKTQEEDPWVIVLLRKGKALLAAQKPLEALACYDEILRLQPEHTTALVKRGAALEQMRQEEDALECYERALRLDPKLTLAYLHKGAVCNRLERYEEALECYQQAMRVEEDERRAAAFV